LQASVAGIRGSSSVALTERITNAASPKPSIRSRAMRDGFILGSLAYGAAIVTGLLETPVDPTIFYSGRLPDPYTQLTYSVLHTGFFYSPAIAQVLEPFRILPVALFGALWVGGLLCLLYAMLGRRAILGLLFIPVAWEISTGNIHLVFDPIAHQGHAGGRPSVVPRPKGVDVAGDRTGLHRSRRARLVPACIRHLVEVDRPDHREPRCHRRLSECPDPAAHKAPDRRGPRGLGRAD
jgi:hypothetical protein